MLRNQFLTALLLAAGIGAAQTPPPASCRSPEARQFDFSVGDWEMVGKRRLKHDASHWQETRSTNSIRSVLDGCVTQETFQNVSPATWTGMSVSSWNPQTRRWQQTWVDSQGGYITLTGAFANGRMVLTTEPRSLPDNTTVMNRMVYRDIAADSLMWSWDLSRDGGRSWTPQWEITYRRKK